ncbi:MAG: hypothetical protein AAGN35_26135 [Bacteroidota bacterium]
MIQLEHVLAITRLELGNEIAYAFVHEVDSVIVSLACDLVDHKYFGVHALSCLLEHKPLACDFSHVEIQIRHVFPLNGIVNERVYRHVDWSNNDFCVLAQKKPKRFLKDLRAEYRAKIGTIFNKVVDQ